MPLRNPVRALYSVFNGSSRGAGNDMFGPDWDILLRYLQNHPGSDRLSEDEFSYYIRIGVALGEAIASSTLRRFGEIGPEEILQLQGVTVASAEAPPAEGVQILAEYRPSPPTVTVYPSRLDTVKARLPEADRDYFSPRLLAISLAHELYHFLWETQYQGADWMSLIRSLGFSPLVYEVVPPKRVFLSPLTQEFAALQFSKSLLNLSRSPALLCLE